MKRIYQHSRFERAPHAPSPDASACDSPPHWHGGRAPFNVERSPKHTGSSERKLDSYNASHPLAPACPPSHPLVPFLAPPKHTSFWSTGKRRGVERWHFSLTRGSSWRTSLQRTRLTVKEGAVPAVHALNTRAKSHTPCLCRATEPAAVTAPSSASAAAATRADPPDVDTEEKAAHVTVIASRATVHQRVKYARVRSLLVMYIYRPCRERRPVHTKADQTDFIYEEKKAKLKRDGGCCSANQCISDEEQASTLGSWSFVSRLRQWLKPPGMSEADVSKSLGEKLYSHRPIPKYSKERTEVAFDGRVLLLCHVAPGDHVH